MKSNIIFENTEDDKQKIINLFMKNVKNKEIILNNTHCGREGWQRLLVRKTNEYYS